MQMQIKNVQVLLNVKEIVLCKIHRIPKHFVNQTAVHLDVTQLSKIGIKLTPYCVEIDV